MIGVVIPAHNEADSLGNCLHHVFEAAKAPALAGEPVRVVVVLDACDDDTHAVARSYGAHIVAVEARNVGVARATGAAWCIAAGARWLAFTDADTEVATDWLVQQLAQGADAVCGTVAVRDWGTYGDLMRQHYDASYTDADDHAHIHGANLGVSASAYERAGGFEALACSEDVALVRSLERTGASIAWSARPRVWTSARRDFRAAGGFGATLMRVEAASQAQRAADSCATP